MLKFISFDMDGTLVDPGFTDWVWAHGIPTLYAERTGLSFEKAKDYVVKEYLKVGEGAMEWYDIKYWFRLFELGGNWKAMMERYMDKIKVYSDVHPLLERLRGSYPLVLTSNAGREFIDMEMEATGLAEYFDRIFSATSDFGEVKKTAGFYQKICRILDASPPSIVHVGDHYQFDYIVPSSLGIHAFYINRDEVQTDEFVLSDLRELERRIPAIADERG